jgi:hypothetical protein
LWQHQNQKRLRATTGQYTAHVIQLCCPSHQVLPGPACHQQTITTSGNNRFLTKAFTIQTHPEWTDWLVCFVIIIAGKSNITKLTTKAFAF